MGVELRLDGREDELSGDAVDARAKRALCGTRAATCGRTVDEANEQRERQAGGETADQQEGRDRHTAELR